MSFDRAAYLNDIERRVCRVLAELPPTHSMRRFPDLSEKVFGEGTTGGTVLASVLGSLKTKGYVEEALPAHREPGRRYRLTGRGHLAVELMVLLEGKVA